MSFIHTNPSGLGAWRVIARFAKPAAIPLMALVVGPAMAQAPADPSRCEPILGRNYDSQSGEEKSARMVRYLTCRKDQDLHFLRSRHDRALREISAWRVRNSHVVGARLASKRLAAAAELEAAHHAERERFAAEYEAQYATLSAQQNSENHYQINEKRNEVSKRRQQEWRKLQQRLSSERREMSQAFNGCAVTSTDQIRQIVANETISIDEQMVAKSQSLSSQYDALISAPMNMSVADYEKRKSASGAGTRAQAPVGAVEEATGSVTITRPSGETVKAERGTPVHMGDVVETGADSDCRIVFVDESTVDVSDQSRMPIDEYVYEEPGSEKGGSVLRALFVFTSGLIGGKKEARDVEVQGCCGGIRG